MKADVLRHWLCDASGASQPAGIVKAIGRNSSARVVRFIRFGAVFLWYVYVGSSSSLCFLSLRARTAALFSLLFPRPRSGAVQPAVQP